MLEALAQAGFECETVPDAKTYEEEQPVSTSQFAGPYEMPWDEDCNQKEMTDKRQAYLIQANGKRKSPKALDTRGSGDCLLLDASIWNGHFRRKRPTIAHQVLSTGANEKEIV